MNVPGRRRFLGAAAGAFARTQLVHGGVANARPILDGSVDLAQAETPDGIGHDLPQEAPDAFSQAVIDLSKG